MVGYATFVAFGAGFVIGTIVGILIVDGLSKLKSGDSATRKRFAWFLSILYALSIVAEIRWGYHVPMPLHVIAGMAAGYIFGVENPVPQLFGLRTGQSSSSEESEQ